MQSHRAAIMAFCFVAMARAHAQEPSLCASVAHHLWSEVAIAPLHEQTPLSELAAAAPASFQASDRIVAVPDRPIAGSLFHDHVPDPVLGAKLRDLPPREALRFGNTDVWLLDRVDGTLGCHTPMAVVVPTAGAAHEIALPANANPTDQYALSALTAVWIDRVPALWIEQSGAFSSSSGHSAILIAALQDGTFAPPCTVLVDYSVTGQATHAFCDGIDCVPLIRTAQILTMRLRQGETAETLGAGVIGPRDNANDYRRMVELEAANKPPAELPTFGVSLNSGYTTFTDELRFPLRLGDGYIYLARLGHGGFGWRETADTLLALYRLRDDRAVPAASVYVEVRRTAISRVTIQ